MQNFTLPLLEKVEGLNITLCVSQCQYGHFPSTVFIYRRQILMSKDGPRTERKLFTKKKKIFTMGEDP